MVERRGAGGPQPGAVIGTYRLVRLIGEGATGRVFEVEHLTIGRRAAMKILAPDHAGRPGAIKRLFSEARAVNQINHPHIVEVTDLIEATNPGDVNAIVMELLEGQSLADAIRRESPFSPERFIPILSQVADALEAAHGARFIHRDLKPDNIYLTARAMQRDYVKLLDFGLAKAIGDDNEAAPTPTALIPTSSLQLRAHATAEGTFVGTPAYASPEQASGKPLDHRTDIYSLGVILYELLCGKLPFEGRNFGEYLVKHLTQPVPEPPPEVKRTAMGRALAGVARRCLQKDPQARWESAGELKRVFEAIARGEAVEIPGAVGDRRRGLTKPLAATAAIALIVAGAATQMKGPSPPRIAVERAASAAPSPAPPAKGPGVLPLTAQRPVVVQFVCSTCPAPPARGAETRRVGNDQLLGMTPFFHTFVEADGSAVEVEMRLPGYAPRRHKVVLSGGVAITVDGKLRRLPAAARAKKAPEPAAPARRKMNRNTTLNPFAP